MAPPRIMRAFAAGALALAACGGASASRVTPTQKVITMLTEMKAKGEKMMEEEQKTFANYAEWVDDRSKELTFEIKDATAREEELVAAITKAESDAQELGREIEELDAEISQLTEEKAKANTLRQSQHEEYQQVSTDYAESVDALKRAIGEVSAQDMDREQAASLLQRMSAHVRGMPRVLAAFLEESERQRSDDAGAPAVAAYKFQSGGILSLLEGLLKKFKTELAEVDEAEVNQAHEFDLVDMHLKNTIEKDTSDMKEKTVTRSKRMAAAAEGKGELQKTKAEKAADEKLKAEIESTFKVKSQAFEENQKVRKAELEAVAKATEIMSSPEVSDSYSKRINLLQVDGRAVAPSFLQLRGSSRQRLGSSATAQAAALLGRRAQALRSDTLSALAGEMAAGSPFAKVIDMVEGLIAKLKKEAAEEAEHKAWCDEQLKDNKLKRDKKTAQAEQLMAEIESLTAQIAEAGQTIAKLIEEQQSLTKAMSEATELRQKEKAENKATIEDAEGGIQAVKSALVVLKEFYSAQSSGAALLQEGQVPEMESYHGMQSGSGGVIGMLEVIQSDFSRLKHETEAAEKAAVDEYDKFMEDSTATKEKKHREEVQLKLDKDQAEFEETENEKDLKAVQAELSKANEYFERLKPACLEVHVSFEERAARRKEEIEALKEAWGILDQKSSD